MSFESLFPYFLIIGVVSLVVGPIMWMQPSTREKQLAQLRMDARAQGLNPQIVPRPEQIRQVESDTVAKYSYFLRGHKRSIINSKQLFSPVRNEAGIIIAWQNEKERTVDGRLGELMMQLPQSSYLLEMVGNSASLCWKETGGVDQLKIISGTFLQLLLWYKNNP
ncbi:MAG: hypothetical protein ACJAQS_000951 [Porticoccus sp.]